MYAWYFQRTRRLWPLILAHVLFDMTQLVFILPASRPPARRRQARSNTSLKSTARLSSIETTGPKRGGSIW